MQQRCGDPLPQRLEFLCGGGGSIEDYLDEKEKKKLGIMDFAFCAGFGSFILHRPSAPVFGGGYLVKTDAVSDAGDDELRGSRDLGAGSFCPFVCIYI